MFELAESKIILKKLFFLSIILSVDNPIEPVEPRIEIDFII